MKVLHAKIEMSSTSFMNALKYLSQLSYHNRADYLCVYELPGITVINPSNHKAVVTDQTQLPDNTDKYFVCEIVEMMQKQDMAIVRHVWPKLRSEAPQKKRQNYVCKDTSRWVLS